MEKTYKINFLIKNTMEKFEYRAGILTQTVEISKEMIVWKNKQIPSNQITGFGIGSINVGRMAVGNVLGGAVGMAIANSGSSALDKNANLKELSGLCQLVIAYKEGMDEKAPIKKIQIPLSLKDENCIKMLEKLKTDYSSKYVGAGSLNQLISELKISQKAVFIAVGIIIAIVVAFAIYATIQQ